MMWQDASIGGGVQHVRDHDRSLVLRWLTRQQGISRTEIALRVGLTGPAISRIVRDLMELGLVCEDGSIATPNRPGRRHIGLGLVPRVGYAAAVRLTVSDHGVSLLDLTGTRVANVELPEVLTAEAEAIPGLVVAVQKTVTIAEISSSRVLGAGVVTVGAVDPVQGTVKRSSIRGLSGQSLGPKLERLLGMPVRLRTVGHALHMAERLIVERQAAARVDAGSEAPVDRSVFHTALLVHVAVGLGASMISDGRPHCGNRDERLISHMPVPGATELCVCGAQGCLLTLVSGYAIMRRLTAEDRRRPGVGQLCDYQPAALRGAVEQANAGDPGTGAIFYEAGRALGWSLFAACATLPPERTTLAGPVPQAREYAAGVRDGLSAAWQRNGHAQPAVMVTTVDYARAAELFALEEFLLNIPIDTQRLLAA